MAACLTGAGLFFSFMGVFSYIDFRLERPPFSLSPAVIGLVFVLWVMGAAGPLAGRLADRHGWRAVALGGLLLCAGGLTLSLVPVLGVVIVGLSLVTLGNFSAVTAAQLGVAGATDRDRGVASAMYFSGYYVAGALGAYVPGLAWEQWHWTGVWAMALAAYAVGAAALVAAATLARPCAPSPAPPADSSSSSRTPSACAAAPSSASSRERRELVTLSPGAARCANLELAGCNWLVDATGELCASCRLTRTRPADDDAEGLEHFRDAEAAKRWLLFELGELGLPVQSWRERDGGLAFELLSSDRGPVTTGHADGVITLDVAESDDAHREALREQLGEPYRTVLGHFRHEIGHYYWPLLVPEGPARERCRALFGDEREDYGAALERHYETGPPPDWSQRFVSAYATMHPWEDWAETFAHYLHIWDTLQTAGAFGVNVRGAEAPAPDGGDFRELLDDWLPLTYALNALSRSMGRDDLYPFVLPAPVVDKLAFVHERVTAAPRPG